ncbi:MAG: dihydrodipicolinate synthase family protein [Phycisphaerae bacterium]
MNRHSLPFRGIWPAMVTPFDADDRLSIKATRRLVARFIEEGAGGIYVCGSTGEAALLRVEERKALAECVVSEVAGQIPVMVQVGHTAPVLALDLAEHAARCGADAISSTLPPFYSYNAAQIAGYWSTLTRGHDLPFFGYVLQDIGTTWGQVSRWLEATTRVPNLVGFKFTNPDAYQISLLKAWSDGKLNILSGHDQGYLACRAHGADGAIGTTYNIALPLWRRVSCLYEAGDTAGATEAMNLCARVVAQITSGHLMSRVKLILRRQGIDCGRARPPLRPEVDLPDSAVDEAIALIDSALRRFGRPAARDRCDIVKADVAGTS